MRPQNTILLFVAGFLVSACTNSGSPLASLSSAVAKCGQSENCTIELSKVVPKDWGQFYYFEYGATDEVIQKVLGPNTDCLGVFTDKFVFLKSGKMISCEQYDVDVERAKKNEIMFDIGSANYIVVDEAHSVFRVEKIPPKDGGPYYLLSQ